MVTTLAPTLHPSACIKRPLPASGKLELHRVRRELDHGLACLGLIALRIRGRNLPFLRTDPAYRYAEETGITSPLVMSTISPRSAPVIAR